MGKELSRDTLKAVRHCNFRFWLRRVNGGERGEGPEAAPCLSTFELVVGPPAVNGAVSDDL